MGGYFKYHASIKRRGPGIGRVWHTRDVRHGEVWTMLIYLYVSPSRGAITALDVSLWGQFGKHVQPALFGLRA